MQRSLTKKRVFDLIASILLVTIFFLPILFITVLVRVKLGKPILFYQIRPGLETKPFKMVKFRTMLESKSTKGTLLSDSERLTPFGRKLRASSLDELPELWNVLKGEMSLVGPRPLLPEYLPLYSKRQMRRHEVRPGITGWAQVNGRNSISWKQKFELDLYYIENQSFWLDLRILYLTMKNVFAKKGITSDTSDSMEKFTGNDGE